MSKHIEKDWPILVSKARTGKSKYWQVRVQTCVILDGTGLHAYVEREWWVEGGKHQIAEREVFGKNVGRSNETTPLQQALLEAEAEYKKQLDDGYMPQGEAGIALLTQEGQDQGFYTQPAVAAGTANTQTGLLLPMLAHDFTKRGKKLDWSQGMFAQPKLDGFRCLYNSAIGFWSRGGKPFDQAVDLSHLHFDTQGLTFDGELMLPAPYTFQQTCQAIKKQRDETRFLIYHVFDVVLEGVPYAERLIILQNEITGRKVDFCKPVVVVPTVKIAEVTSAQPLLGQYIESGYEGLILRTPGGLYDVGNRSPDLLKYKEFDTNEFQVTGAEQGAGKDAGTIIFVCGISTPSGMKEFKARPRGTYGQRKLWWDTREELIGRFLTVRHQGYSDEGLPRFPIGIDLRDMVPAGQPVY